MLSKSTRDAVKWALMNLGEEVTEKAKQQVKDYCDEFLWLWDNYPSRGSSGKGDKRKGYNSCLALIKDGEDWKSLARYMKAYEQSCIKDEKMGTSYVMQFNTFFGSGERYKDDYSIKDKPEKKTATQSLIDRANSGELYQTDQNYYLRDGKKWDCAADYFAGKPPLED